MKGLKTLIMGLIFCMAIAYSPFASQAAKLLDLGDPVGGPPDAPHRIAMEYFCSEVSKRTNGEVIIKYHPATIVTNEVKAVEMCKAGSLAFCTPGAGTATIFPNVQPFEMPFLIRDHNHYRKVVQGTIGREMEEEILKKHNLKVLYWSDFGFRQFLNSKRPINKPEDLIGLKLRIPPSPPLRDMVNALGASAVPISWGETIPAVQQGVVDGLDLAVINIIKFKVYEVAKYAAISKHSFTTGCLLVNNNVWNGLTSAQQNVILQVGSESADKNRELMEAGETEAKALLEKYGMKVTTPDLQPFRNIATDKVYPKYYDKFGKTLFERIINVK